MHISDPRSTSSAQDNTGKASAPIVQNDSQLNSDSTDQSATNRKIGKDSASPQKVPRRVTAATWVVRLCFAFVFVVNVQCALGFALAPEAYMGATSSVACQVAWPLRHRYRLPHVELHLHSSFGAPSAPRPRQRRTGSASRRLVGESLIRATLPAGHDLLASSIDLFIAFDAIGLVLMAASWGIFFLLEKRTCARIHA